MPDVPAIAHVTLTVSDLDRSVQWYERLFDVEFRRDESLGPFRRAVWLVEGQTLVGLHEFPIHLTTFRLMSVEIGLDHLAFACRDRDELEAWEIRLTEFGISNGGIVDAGYGSGLSCHDPDNIALEFFTLAP